MEQSPTEYTFLLPHELPLSFPFDSARDSLIASTLAPLAINQEDLKKDYPYQYIEFRDKRKLETILKGLDTGKIQMNKQQADTLRNLHTTLKRRRDVSEEAFQTELKQKPFLYPPRLSDSTVHTQEFKAALDPRPLPDFATLVSRLPSLQTPNAPPRFECDDKLYKKIKSHELLTTLFLKRADVDRVQKFRRDIQGKVKEAGSLSSEFMREIEREQESLVDAFSKSNDDSGSLDLSLILDQTDVIPPQPSRNSFPKEAQVIDAMSAEAGALDESYLHTLEKEKGEDSENVKMDFERSEEEIEKGSREEGSITRDNKDESSEQAQTPADNRRIRSPTLTPESPRANTPMEWSPAHTTQSEAKFLTDEDKNEKREKFLRDCRLGPVSSNLPTLNTQEPFSFTSLDLVESPTELLSLSYSLQWNPVPYSEVIARIGPLERTKGERITQRDLKRKARDSRERMTGDVEVADGELRDDLVVEIDDLTVRTDEGDSQDPFQLLYRSPSPASSPLSAVYSASIHAHDHDRSHDTLITADAPSEPITNPPSPSPPTSSSTWPSHPPPYTIPRRRASSLPTPSRLSLDTPIVPPVINGKALDVDEFGFIGAGATFPSSTPPVSSPSPCPQPTRSTSDQVDDPMPQEDDAQGDDRSTMQIDSPQTAEAPVASAELQVAPITVPQQRTSVVGDSNKRTRIGGGGGKPSSTFQLSEAMNRFMSTRTKEAETQPERPSSATTAKPPSQPKISRALSAPDPHSSPPPGSIPFSIPPFLSNQPSTSHRDTLRVVILDSVLQMRRLYIALQKFQFELVHRPSRFPSTRYTLQDPDLILSGTSCVCFFKLIDLIGNAVREDPPNSTTLSRQESVFTTLRRFASRYDRVLVILEEQQQSKQSKAVKAYSYTTPVLQGLRQLAQALEDLRSQESVEGKCGIEVAISKGPEHSAELTRKFAEYLEGEDEKEARPGMKVRGSRTWLLDNPLEDESKLLEISSELNEISASAILSRCTANQFTEMDPDEAIMTFSSVCGEERIRRILGVENDVPTSSSSSRPSFAQPAISNLLVDNDTSFSPYKFSLSSIGERRSEAPSGDVRFEDVFDVERYDGER